MAKELLGQVLSETLQVLVQRYARAQPSYKRHLQIRYGTFKHLMVRSVPKVSVYKSFY